MVRHLSSRSTSYAVQEQHRWIMTFKNVDTERHFVEMQADMLARNVFRGSLACAGVSLLVMVSLATEELSNIRSEATWRLNFATAVTCAGMSAAVATAAKLPRALKLLTPQRREVAFMALLCVLGALQFGLDPWYGTKLLQHEPDLSRCDQNAFSDTRPVLVLSTLVLASHLTLPIRWICLVPLEVVLWLLYVGFAFILGGPDGYHAWSTCLLLLGLILSAIIGRRTIEDHQRQTFVTIIKERNLRAQSEFELEQAQGSKLDAGSAAESRQSASEAASRPETTSSCLVFEAHNQGHVCVKTFTDLGHREQWYIHSHEVELHTEVLGQGSYGVVIAGEYHGSPVAVKTTRIKRSHQDRNSKRECIMSLLNEIRIMRRLRHPNIVLLHGASLDSSQKNLSIILEQVFGKSLEDIILDDNQQAQLLPSDKLVALAQLSRALRYLHSREPPVAHGDLKASNIVAEQIPGVNLIHRVKLLDFGLARALTRHAKPLGGSLAWMAPELVLHPGRRPEVSADVFSFGRVAHFVLTGIAALGQMTAEEIRHRIRTEALPAQAWPRQLDPRLMGCWVCVEPCVSFSASLRPSMDTAGRFFEKLIFESSSGDARSRQDGESDSPQDGETGSRQDGGQTLGSSEQELGSGASAPSDRRPLPGSSTGETPTSSSSHSPRPFTSILPGTLEDGDGDLFLPAARGRHFQGRNFPVQPGDSFQSEP